VGWGGGGGPRAKKNRGHLGSIPCRREKEIKGPSVENECVPAGERPGKGEKAGSRKRKRLTPSLAGKKSVSGGDWEGFGRKKLGGGQPSKQRGGGWYFTRKSSVLPPP